MKKLKLLALGLIGAAVMTTSCTKDDEDNPAPLLSVEETTTSNSSGTITVTPGTTITLKWNARVEGTGADLKTFSVSYQGNNPITPFPDSDAGNSFPYSISSSEKKQYIDQITMDAGSNLGTGTWTFTVTDKDGKSTTATFIVIVENASTPLNNETMGGYFHIGGSLEGAYDLVNGAVVAASGSATDKDMINTDAAGATFTGSFESGNGTMFVKATSFDYVNATEEAAIATYVAGTPAISMSNPANNDIYVAKLRGGNDYVVIKVTNVDPTDNTCNCGNTGKMSFDFKKK